MTATPDGIGLLPGTPLGEADGLRMHYVEAGPAGGSVILLLHGQPTWGYLYRTMIPVLAGAGMRVIAPDHIGMGRSGKPVRIEDYRYLRHVAWMEQFMDRLAPTGSRCSYRTGAASSDSGCWATAPTASPAWWWPTGRCRW